MSEAQEKTYKKRCRICARGREPVRREVVPGTFMWVHDSVVTCWATVQREEDKNRAAIETQKGVPAETGS